MTTYATTEAALFTLCKAYNSGLTFIDTNSKRGEWTIFDAPQTEALVLVQSKESRYGDSLDKRGAQGKRQEQHFICVEVYYKRGQGAGGDGAKYVALITLRDALIGHLNRYPRLNNAANVKRAEIVSASQPALAGASPQNAATHWMSEIEVTVMCEIALDLTESIY